MLGDLPEMDAVLSNDSPLTRLAPAYNSSALINYANKLKETALHMACMMERSKVTPWLWMHASRVLIVP